MKLYTLKVEPNEGPEYGAYVAWDFELYKPMLVNINFADTYGDKLAAEICGRDYAKDIGFELVIEEWDMKITKVGVIKP